MMCMQRWQSLTFAAAIISTVGVSSALAQTYEWTPSQVSGLADVTSSFHGGAGQLSTIDAINATEDGLQLDITFRIGQEADPFAPNYGLGFARVSLAGGLGFPGLDLSAYDSSSIEITIGTDVTIQSFLQTDFTEDGGAIDDGDGTPDESFSFLFWEQSADVAAGGPTDVAFDFSSATEFDGNWNVDSPQPVQGAGAIRQWGLQVAKFSGMTIGEPVPATVMLVGVPEPASAGLAALAAVGLCAAIRRRG